MAKDCRAPCADKIDQIPGINRVEAATGGGFDKKRLSAHATKGSDWRVYSTGDMLFG